MPITTTHRVRYASTIFHLFVFLALVGISAPSQAADATWKIDAAHSKILFTVTHMVINEVNGWFADFEGTLTQPADGTFDGSALVVHIKTATVNTGNDGRDKHLQGTDFFDAEKYPVTTFTATRFKKITDADYDITGILDLHGVQKPVQLQARFNGTIKDARGKMHAGFKATTTFNRYDYDLKWNKTLESGGMLVSDKVDLTLNMEFVKQ